MFYWGNILLGSEEALYESYPDTDNEEIAEINILNGTKTIAFGALRALAKVESIVFPEGVEYVYSGVLPRDNGSLKSVSFSSTVKEINLINFSVSTGATSYYDFPLTLESITVAEDNPYYRVENDCLIEIDSATLIGSLKTATAVPEGVKIIAQNAMRGNVNNTVVIPSDVTTIMGGAFNGGAMSEMNIPDVSSGASKPAPPSVAMSSCVQLAVISSAVMIHAAALLFLMFSYMVIVRLSLDLLSFILRFFDFLLSVLRYIGMSTSACQLPST